MKIGPVYFAIIGLKKLLKEINKRETAAVGLHIARRGGLNYTVQLFFRVDSLIYCVIKQFSEYLYGLLTSTIHLFVMPKIVDVGNGRRAFSVAGPMAWNSLLDFFWDTTSSTGGFRHGSVAEWLACWTQAQKGPGSNRSRDAVG